jgi:hypothetical protein
MSTFHAFEVATIVQCTVCSTVALAMIGSARRHAAWRHAIGVSGLLLVLVSPLLAAILPRAPWLSRGEPRTNTTRSAAIASRPEPIQRSELADNALQFVATTAPDTAEAVTAPDGSSTTCDTTIL